MVMIYGVEILKVDIDRAMQKRVFDMCGQRRPDQPA